MMQQMTIKVPKDARSSDPTITLPFSIRLEPHAAIACYDVYCNECHTYPTVDELCAAYGIDRDQVQAWAGETAYDKARADGLSTGDCLQTSREAEQFVKEFCAGRSLGTRHFRWPLA